MGTILLLWVPTITNMSITSFQVRIFQNGFRRVFLGWSGLFLCKKKTVNFFIFLNEKPPLNMDPQSDDVIAAESYRRNVLQSVFWSRSAVWNLQGTKKCLQKYTVQHTQRVRNRCVLFYRQKSKGSMSTEILMMYYYIIRIRIRRSWKLACYAHYAQGSQLRFGFGLLRVWWDLLIYSSFRLSLLQPEGKLFFPMLRDEQ